MPNATPRQGQQQARRVPGNFLTDTRQSIVTLSPMVPPTANVAGQVTTQQLPSSGFLSAIWFIMSALTTTIGGGATVVRAYPQTPWGLIRKIRVYTNMGVELWNTSGYGAYLHMRCQRTGFDPFKGSSNLTAQTTEQNLQYTLTDSGNNTVDSRYYRRATSLGAVATETVRAPFYLPIAWGTLGQAGLQLLQDDAVKYYLEITWGDNTDLYTTFTNATLTAQTLTPIVETFATPRDPNNRPDLSLSKVVLEDTQAFDTGSGINTYKFVTGNMLTRLIQEFSNGSTAAPLDPTQFTNMEMDYANTQVPYNMDPNVQLFRQRILFGSDLPQGCYVWDLASALGLPEFPTLRDVINTIKLTNLNTKFTLSGVTPTSSQFRTVKEMLVPNRRF